MRILGVTQGSNLRVFLRLAEMLKEPLGLSDISAYVADSQEYYALQAAEPLLRDPTFHLLKEWEITREGVARQPDWKALREWEAILGDPVLWNALMADRRIFLGKLCKLRQDYKPRFTHTQMYAIAQTAAERIAEFIYDRKPDVILGFGTSTFGDYLLYRFARAKGIAYLQLKATKIGNYVSLNDDALKLSSHIATLIENPNQIPSAIIGRAREHLAQIRERGVRYEGVLKSTARLRPIRGFFGSLRGLVRDTRNQLHPVVRSDNHVESAMLNALYTNIVQPAKLGILSLLLQHKLVGLEDVEHHRPFAFFPLHFEPEVALQVFGRPFQNQIEVVRNLALSLPAGMLVLVKEHPRALGFRPYGYYRKLLEIPNVRLVDHRLPTHRVIRNADLVAVISGSTGFEAAVLGKPVITFGLPTYRNLSQKMVMQISSLHDLGSDIRGFLAGFHTDVATLEHFVAAHIAGSVPVDLYSVLLAKPDRLSEGREGVSQEERRQQDYLALADYCTGRITDAVYRSKSDEE